MKKCTVIKIFKQFRFLRKEFNKILRSDRRYIKVVAVVILCIQNYSYSGIVTLFEGNFHQGIKLHIIYFSLTDINIRTEKSSIFH